MKSFSIYCVVRRALLVGLLLFSALGVQAKKPAPTPETLTNFQLSPVYSRWLIGAVYYIASEREIDQYLGLLDDAAAKRFIDAFWERRDSNGAGFGNPLLETYRKRTARADVLYDQPPIAGHQTDRGTIYVLYGPPDKTEIQTATELNAPPLEVWSYPERPVGLDGKKARPRFEFILEPDGTARLTRKPL